MDLAAGSYCQGPSDMGATQYPLTFMEVAVKGPFCHPVCEWAHGIGLQMNFGV